MPGMKITPGRLWYLLKLYAGRGPGYILAEKVFINRIFSWQVFLEAPYTFVPLHLLASKHDWKMALWMLASFHEASGRRWPVVLHEDGSLGEGEISIFRRLFPQIRVITRLEADATMLTALQKYPRCAEYRRKMPHGLKAFDIPFFCQSDRFLMVDPDVLFFQKPVEILDWVDCPPDGSCWFNQDFQEPSPLSQELSIRDLGVQLWPRVNSGLCLLNKKTVSDLGAMESYLAHPALQDSKIQWRVEQTLLALCASKANLGGLLPASYKVSPNKHRQPYCVARHYVGCVRDRFLSEGVKELYKKML